jgi:hypothetical protein
VKEKAVLGQESSEQQPVPLLIGALSDKQLAVAAELTPLGPEADAKRRLFSVEVLWPAIDEHTETVDRRASSALGCRTSR